MFPFVVFFFLFTFISPLSFFRSFREKERESLKGSLGRVPSDASPREHSFLFRLPHDRLTLTLRKEKREKAVFIDFLSRRTKRPIGSVEESFVLICVGTVVGSEFLLINRASLRACTPTLSKVMPHQVSATVVLFKDAGRVACAIDRKSDACPRKKHPRDIFDFPDLRLSSQTSNR